jgi:hypothetical protein
MNSLKRLLVWAQKNERHLGAVLFIFGFITDLFTFAFLPVAIVNLAFIGYLALAVVATLGSHLFSGAREHPTLWRRALSIVFPLAAQYAIGSLLSGCLIFYAKSAAVIVSWPFLLIIALVFIGNEYFRTYYKHLAFQIVLLFFGIYAYAIFALPLLVHQLGPWIFVASTVLSLVALALFLLVVARMRRPGFGSSMRYILPATGLIVVVMSVSYFTGLVPPIPLTMPDAGIYYAVTRSDDHYVVQLENTTRNWWDITTPVVHHFAGTPLFAFSSVSAPFKFGASVVHVWERHDDTKNRWMQESRIEFPISGGRDGGYRGYSEVSDPAQGKWRVTIETMGGQVIGRLYFNVVNVDIPPLIKEENK